MSQSTQSTTHTPALEELIGQPDGPRVIDVRTPAEFESVHIPGSYNVPLDVLREHREELADALGQDVVLVCRSGLRAQQAEQALAGAGLTRLHVLDGGITGFQTRGGQVVHGVQRWELERQIRLVAGSLVIGSVLTSALLPKAKWLAAAVGGGLTYAALSNTCLMGMALAKLPYNRRTEADPARVIAELTR